MQDKTTDIENGEAGKVIHSSRQALDDIKSEASASQEHLIPPLIFSSAMCGEVKAWGKMIPKVNEVISKIRKSCLIFNPSTLQKP